jgi:hypothetical protein
MGDRTVVTHQPDIGGESDAVLLPAALDKHAPDLSPRLDALDTAGGGRE